MTFLKKQKEEPIQDTPTPETASGTTEFDEELTMEEMEAKVQEVMEKYDPIPVNGSDFRTPSSVT